MAKDPAVLFYTGDFLNGTAFFTDEQRGQYILLLCQQHQVGHIPENHMVSICKAHDNPVLQKFKRDSEGNYYNERMEEEILKRKQFIDSRRDNGTKGGRPTKHNGKPYAKPNGYATENLIGDGNDNDNRTLLKGESEGKILIDYQFIIDNYHSLCPNMSKVISLNEQRKGFVNARAGEYGMDKVIQVLRIAGESEFLNGRNDKAWKADFEWIMRPQNFLKILEGKYQNKKIRLAV